LLRCEATRIGRAKLSPSPCKRPGHDLKVLNYSPSFSLLETQQGGRAPFRAPTRFPVRCRSPVARAHFTQRTAAHRRCWRLAAARLPLSCAAKRAGANGGKAVPSCPGVRSCRPLADSISRRLRRRRPRPRPRSRSPSTPPRCWAASTPSCRRSVSLKFTGLIQNLGLLQGCDKDF
jgi:hypothetical protein